MSANPGKQTSPSTPMTAEILAAVHWPNLSSTTRWVVMEIGTRRASGWDLKEIAEHLQISRRLASNLLDAAAAEMKKLVSAEPHEPVTELHRGYEHLRPGELSAIRRLHQEENVSLNVLAAMFEISPGAVRKVLQNAHPPSGVTHARKADAQRPHASSRREKA